MFALLEIEKYCSCAYCSSHRSNETILVSYIFRSMQTFLRCMFGKNAGHWFFIAH